MCAPGCRLRSLLVIRRVDATPPYIYNGGGENFANYFLSEPILLIPPGDRRGDSQERFLFPDHNARKFVTVLKSFYAEKASAGFYKKPSRGNPGFSRPRARARCRCRSTQGL